MKNHPELANGKNFTCVNHEFNPKENENYRKNYDEIFKKKEIKVKK